QMNLYLLFLLLICSVSLHRVGGHLPDFTPATPQQVGQDRSVSVLLQVADFNVVRLPGLCRRLKRRRVTVLCNLDKFCWGRSRGRSQKSGQVCRCPRGSRCSHFFVHSL
uniref:Cocaine- and amphetamine-regulated transcript protein n=1 Tax=Acanthochromis polyacanthus TaxID=80966 RepID=A0A3Q1FDN4_9TELE